MIHIHGLVCLWGIVFLCASENDTPIIWIAKACKTMALLVEVEEHLRQVEELGNELLDVGGVALAVPPRGGHGVEGAVGVVELAVLQVEEVGGEGLEAHEPVEREGGG